MSTTVGGMSTPASPAVATAVAAWALAIWRMVAAAGLAVLTGLLLWSLLPMALGWGSHVVLSDSMAPGIRTGDVVAAQPVSAADVAPGQVILFSDPSRAERTVVHRFVRLDEHGRLVTRGDANISEDSTALGPEHVQALPRLLIPWVGRPTTWLAEGRTAPLGAGALVVALALLAVATVRGEEGDEVDRVAPGARSPFALGFGHAAAGRPAHTDPPGIAARRVETAPARHAPTTTRTPRDRRRRSGPPSWSTPFPTGQAAMDRHAGS